MADRWAWIEQRQPIDDRVTRALCALLYVEQGVCDAVWTGLMAHPQRAWGLSPEVDTAALLRHAHRARRRSLVRDAVILGILVALVTVVTGPLVHRHGAVVLLLAAVIATTGWIVWHLLKTRRDPAQTPWPFLALSLPIAGFLFLVGANDLRFGMIATATALTLAWVVNLIHWCRSILRVRELWRGGLMPGELAPRLPEPVEGRLAGLPGMNVVVYCEARAQVPFVGSGSPLKAWTVPIDTQLGSPDGEKRREPKRVNLGEFYRFLDERWRAERSSALRSGYRLYVDGGRLAPTASLVPDEYGPPVDILDSSCIEDLVEHPVDEEHQRVYHCVESASHDGELVVTSFVHARLRGAVFFVDFTLTALLPLEKSVVRRVRDPAHPVDIGWRALTAASRRPLSLLLRSPVRLALRLRSVAAFVRFRLAGKRAVRRGRHIDLGARTTVREGLAMTRVDALDHNVLRDLDQQAEYLKARTLGILRRFLDDRDIDTSSFDKDRGSIVNNIQTWNIGELQGEVVGLGNANTFAGVVPGTSAAGRAEKGD